MSFEENALYTANLRVLIAGLVGLGQLEEAREVAAKADLDRARVSIENLRTDPATLSACGNQRAIHAAFENGWTPRMT